MTNPRVALVTGGSRGIGAAASVDLARRGFDVAVGYHRCEEAAREVVRRIEALGRQAVALQTDMGRIRDVGHLYDALDAALGRLDVVVNNAAMLERAKGDGIPEDVWDRTMNVNVKGLYFSCLRANERFQHNAPDSGGIKGRIINVGSMGGILATGTSPHYGASKAAVHSLTCSLAEAFAPNVTVNAVAPGFVDTDMIEDLRTIRRHTEAQTPLRRWAKPADVASAIGFLATEAHFITGQVLPVDGGVGNVYVWIPPAREHRRSG